MKNFKLLCLLAAGLLLSTIVNAQQNATKNYKEQYRPQIHFSPKQHWINDPNGMVYFRGSF